MTKYNKNTIIKCANWVREEGLVDFGGAKIKDFCRAMDIDDNTYYDWMRKKEFSDAINEAKEYFRNTLEQRAVHSLIRLVTGYQDKKKRTEYKDVNGKPKITKQTTEDIPVPPNIKAIIFLLTNLAPDRWQLKTSTEQKSEVQMKVDADADILNEIPADVIASIAEQLQGAIESRQKQEESRKLIESSDEADIIEELAEAVE